MSQIVIISGSPAVPSRTDITLKYFESLVNEAGFSTVTYSVTDFAADDLVKGRYDSSDIVKFADVVKQADAVIIGSPVYKASYTGVLKSLLDLLPESVLKNKPVLPMMVGGSTRHLLAIDYSLKPLIGILKGQPLQGLYFVDGEIDKNDTDAPIKDKELLERIQSQIAELVEAIEKGKSAN
ncbi:NADPH-dependent FMN reductase [Peribacillus asahii]|uniref:NADPH-dependent FMN reductase n=1 Tax=Peribacillus asahii TaxID=228899 RepID=UPI00207A6F30|nr:NADPH-dependent FMN reductase [Peribacillus asahii]USK68361.1 NADPH-dependent FMN reductase [Peribacillus asahii]